MTLHGDRGGETFEPDKDRDRLNAQHVRVYHVMKDGHWRSLEAIAYATNDPQASVSARLRDFRKERFGGHRVDRQRVDGGGLFLYRLVWNHRALPPSYERIKEAFRR